MEMHQVPVIAPFEEQQIGNESMIRFDNYIALLKGDGAGQEGFILEITDEALSGGVYVKRAGFDDEESFEMPGAIEEIIEIVRQDHKAGNGEKIDHIAANPTILCALWFDGALDGAGPDGLTVIVDEVVYPVRMYPLEGIPDGYTYATIDSDGNVV